MEKLLDDYLNTSFPDSVVKGTDYGEVDPVMIGADIYGWASQVAKGQPLEDRERRSLAQLRDSLERSLGSFPPPARPYFETVLEIATAALSRDSTP